MPVKVEISELGAGGTTEEVPQWSAEGEKIVKKCLHEHCAAQTDFMVVPLVELSSEHRQLLDQYRTLYEVVAANQLYISKIPAWGHLKDRPPSLGGGMAILADKLGADGILFVSGYDYHSTAGRKTAAVLYAALTGAVMSMGYCVLHSGLIEMKTGEIMWTKTISHGAYSLKNEVHVRELIGNAFTDFPHAREGEGNHEKTP